MGSRSGEVQDVPQVLCLRPFMHASVCSLDVAGQAVNQLQARPAAGQGTTAAALAAATAAAAGGSALQRRLFELRVTGPILPTVLPRLCAAVAAAHARARDRAAAALPRHLAHMRELAAAAAEAATAVRGSSAGGISGAVPASPPDGPVFECVADGHRACVGVNAPGVRAGVAAALPPPVAASLGAPSSRAQGAAAATAAVGAQAGEALPSWLTVARVECTCATAARATAAGETAGRSSAAANDDPRAPPAEFRLFSTA
jgi:hypothetical protein